MFTDRNSIVAVVQTVEDATQAPAKDAIVAAVLIARALDRFTERIDLLIAEAKKPDSAR